MSGEAELSDYSGCQGQNREAWHGAELKIAGSFARGAAANAEKTMSCSSPLPSAALRETHASREPTLGYVPRAGGFQTLKADRLR
jgi:hypothetical protein